jgi:hypothetical protein
MGAEFVDGQHSVSSKILFSIIPQKKKHRQGLLQKSRFPIGKRKRAFWLFLVVMMVMVMVMSAVREGKDAAFLVVAFFSVPFRFNGYVVNAVFAQFLPNGIFDGVLVALYYCMKGGKMALAVQTPQVQMVNVPHSLNVEKMLGQFFGTDATGRFFQKEIQRFLSRFYRFDENEKGSSDGKKGIQKGKIGPLDDQCSDQNHCPTQNIFQHMKIDRFLIQGSSFSGEEGGGTVDCNAYQRKKDHSVIVNGSGIEKPSHRSDHHTHGTDDQDQSGDQASQNRVSTVTVGMSVIRLLLAFAFQIIGNSDAGGIAQIVKGIGQNGNASGPKSAKKFEKGKEQV